MLSCWWKCCFLPKQQTCLRLMATVQAQQMTMMTRRLMESASTVTMDTGSRMARRAAARSTPLPLSTTSR